MNWRIPFVSLLENFRARSEQPSERLREIGLKAGTTFLDVGCALGFYSFYASSIVGEKGLVYALDMNSDFIDYVANKAKRKSIRNVKAIVANAQETGLPSESVDIIFLHLVLHDIGDKPKAIKEFNRILKNNGRLVIDEQHAMALDVVRKMAEESGFRLSKCSRKTVQIFEKTGKQQQTKPAPNLG